MAQVDATNLKKGMKLEITNAPYNVERADYVKPGKGQAFTRFKLRNLITGQSLEKTFKSNEKFTLADVNETTRKRMAQLSLWMITRLNKSPSLLN